MIPISCQCLSTSNMFSCNSFHGISETLNLSYELKHGSVITENLNISRNSEVDTSEFLKND